MLRWALERSVQQIRRMTYRSVGREPVVPARKDRAASLIIIPLTVTNKVPVQLAFGAPSEHSGWSSRYACGYIKETSIRDGVGEKPRKTCPSRGGFFREHEGRGEDLVSEEDRGCRLRNIEDRGHQEGEMILKLIRGHRADVRSVAFDPAGVMLASGGADHDVKVLGPCPSGRSGRCSRTPTMASTAWRSTPTGRCARQVERIGSSAFGTLRRASYVISTTYIASR